VQMICIWSSWCYCHPITCCSSKIQNGLPFWCRLTKVVLEKRPLNGCTSSTSRSSVNSNELLVSSLLLSQQRTLLYLNSYAVIGSPPSTGVSHVTMYSRPRVPSLGDVIITGYGRPTFNQSQLQQLGTMTYIQPITVASWHWRYCFSCTRNDTVHCVR